MLNIDTPLNKAQAALDALGIQKRVLDFYNVSKDYNYLQNKIKYEDYYDIYFSYYNSYMYYLECALWCGVYHFYNNQRDKKAENKADAAVTEWKKGLMKEYKINPKKSLSIHSIYCVEVIGE